MGQFRNARLAAATRADAAVSASALESVVGSWADRRNGVSGPTRSSHRRTARSHRAARPQPPTECADGADSASRPWKCHDSADAADAESRAGAPGAYSCGDSASSGRGIDGRAASAANDNGARSEPVGELGHAGRSL